MDRNILALLNRFTASPGFKAFLIGALVLILTIPLAFVWLLVEDRESRAKTVKEEIAGSWGGRQQIKGPFLVLYYTAERLTGDERKRSGELLERRAVFLPERLSVNGDASTEVRHRSIYETSVYRANVTLEGRFAMPDPAGFESKDVLIHWREANVAVGLGNLSVLKETPALVLGDGRSIPFEPGIALPQNAATGLHARLYDIPQPPPPREEQPSPEPEPASASKRPAKGALRRMIEQAARKSVEQVARFIQQVPNPLPEGLAFKIDLTFNGSSSLDFSPLGRETDVKLASNWPHPSFWGTFLPTGRAIEAKGFSASWRIPYVARNLPASWADAASAVRDMDTHGAPFGVNFYVPVDFYDLVNRATKYALMFVAAGFAAIFVIELVSGHRVHPVQYLFVGIAMVFFYVLLLSLAEHLGFGWAYLIASVATGGLLSLYIGKITDSRRLGGTILAVFLALYGLLYLILGSEDHSLLAGALVGFVMLAVTMFATLRIKWGGEEPPRPS